MSPFLSSCATRAMRFGPGEVMAPLWAGNVAGPAPGRYRSVYISVRSGSRRAVGGRGVLRRRMRGRGGGPPRGRGLGAGGGGYGGGGKTPPPGGPPAPGR